MGTSSTLVGSTENFMAKKHKEEDVWGNAFDTIESKVEAACLAAGRKKRVIYSAYDSDEEDNPIDNLDEVAVEGKVVLIGEKDDFYGGEESKSYVSEVLENPTWLQVTVCANAMIRRTRDLHHVFLEGLDEHPMVGSRKLEEKINELESQGIKVYAFSMGS